MKHTILATLLLLPLSAAAQVAQPQQSPTPTRAEMQVMQNEMVTNLKAKLDLQAQVLDLTAKVEDLQKQLAAKDTPPMPHAKKD